MSEDLNKKIQQIVQMLGQDSVPDNLKELVTLFASSLGTKKDEAGQTASTDTENAENPVDIDQADKSSTSDSIAGTEMLNTARSALEKLNSGSDARISLLLAMKPFMNNRRQKKIGNCIQLLQVASLSRLLNEHEK